jgi:hypothetical protein
MRNFYYFSFDSFSDIVYVFAWYLSSVCINWICLYIFETLCMIFVKFSRCILMIDSYFPHAMKMCTIQGSPKVHHFPLWILASGNSNERDVFDKMVKLTNMLVEPRAQKF